MISRVFVDVMGPFLAFKSPSTILSTVAFAVSSPSIAEPSEGTLDEEIVDNGVLCELFEICKELLDKEPGGALGPLPVYSATSNTSGYRCLI